MRFDRSDGENTAKLWITVKSVLIAQKAGARIIISTRLMIFCGATMKKLQNQPHKISQQLINAHKQQIDYFINKK